MRTAQQEIGQIPIANYEHRIPKTFFCIQCQTTHDTDENMHYYNPLCHRYSYEKRT